MLVIVKYVYLYIFILFSCDDEIEKTKETIQNMIRNRLLLILVNIHIFKQVLFQTGGIKRIILFKNSPFRNNMKS